MAPMYDFGGNGTVINLALANGFPPQTYHPFADPLTHEYRVVSLLPRALWGEAPPQKLINWKDLVAEDLSNGLREQHLTNTILIGHSFGGVASLLTAIRAPKERVKAVILLDPVILPRPGMWMMRLTQLLGGEWGNPMVKGALKRQDHFENVEAAYEKFKNKRLFADWDDAAVRGYAESMLPAEDGGVQLAWSKAWEAYIFKTLYTGTWNDVYDFPSDIPLLLVRGGKSDTFLRGAANRLQRLIPHASYTEITGHGHLFPQSAPEKTRKIVREWLQSQGL